METDSWHTVLSIFACETVAGQFDNLTFRKQLLIASVGQDFQTGFCTLEPLIFVADSHNDGVVRFFSHPYNIKLEAVAGYVVVILFELRRYQFRSSKQVFIINITTY